MMNMNMMMNNQMMGNNQTNQTTNESYTKCLKLEDDTYNITIKKIKTYQISIDCENQFDYLSTHQYSIALTYEEFCKLGKTFRLFDNIDEIFNTIKNLFKGVDFTFKNDNTIKQSNMMSNNGIQGVNNMNMNSNFNMQMNNINMNWNNQLNPLSNNFNQGMSSNNEPNVKLERSTNGSIVLILKIPLLNEKYENIKIELKKESKDIKKQFEKLKKKFLKIKKIAFSDEPDRKNTMNMINPQMNNMNNSNNSNNSNNPMMKNMNMQNMQYCNNNNDLGINIKIPKINSQGPPSAQTILNQIKYEFKNGS